MTLILDAAPLVAGVVDPELEPAAGEERVVQHGGGHEGGRGFWRS